METLYFSHNILPNISIGIFLCIFIFILVKRKDFCQKCITKLKSYSLFRQVLIVSLFAGIILMLIYPSIFSIYLVEKLPDGTLKLKNSFHITIGTIYPYEARKITYEQGVHYYRGNTKKIYYASIQTEEKIYKTISSSHLDILKDNIKRMQK
jgi:hypothetical protein